MNKKKESVLDLLQGTDSVETNEEINTEVDDATIPQKCAECKINVICSALPTFIGLSKVGIIVNITECRFSPRIAK